MYKKLLLFFILPFSPLFLWSASTHEETLPFTSYLFVYFGGEENSESIRFAVSKDGYSYKALNNNQPVLDSRLISSTGGVRDPHILRCEDGKSFYMVATDMVAANGWDSNRGMVLLKSTNLIDWDVSCINIQTKYEGQEELKRVWAPQTIYDKEAGKYMVYWSMKYGEGEDIIYYAYANEDFTDLEGIPQQLFYPQNGKSCIDGDIIYKDGLYHLFYKTEGHGNGIKKAVSSSLTSGNWEESPDYKQQTRKDVEGSCIFKLIDAGKYILMYDVYRNRNYEFVESTDLDTFQLATDKFKLNFHPRHGTIIPITQPEFERLVKKFGDNIEF